MEKKKRSKKIIPYAVVSSLAVILVAGSIYAYTGLNDEPTKKDTTPKTTVNKGKGSKTPSTETRKDREKTNPTLGTVIAKVEEKGSTTGITSSSVVANSPVEGILQTLAKVPTKPPVVSQEVVEPKAPTLMVAEQPNEEVKPPTKSAEPQVPSSPEQPIPEQPVPIEPTPIAPVEPDEPSIPDVINEAPIIEASNQEIAIGSPFNPMDYVSASDKEDGDITGAIHVITNNVNPNEEGTYQITYQVSDSKGLTTEKTITITVVNDRPEITATNQIVSLGDVFNPLEGVTAKDKEDGDITSSIKVVFNNVDTSAEGVYQVTYSVVDNHGKAAQEVTIQVTVKNDLPVIVAEDKVVTIDGSFNPLEGVTASDKQDGDLTSDIQVVSNDVDMQKPGTYHVTYEVIDHNGGTTTKTITVTVEASQMEG
ncbi:DUF5011 domain-containing protein [Listeria welshimeri]|nr:DUF5011 domain-containing protein [Listeria welshimeri]